MRKVAKVDKTPCFRLDSSTEWHKSGQKWLKDGHFVVFSSLSGHFLTGYPCIRRGILRHAKVRKVKKSGIIRYFLLLEKPRPRLRVTGDSGQKWSERGQKVVILR